MHLDFMCKLCKVSIWINLQFRRGLPSSLKRQAPGTEQKCSNSHSIRANISEYPYRPTKVMVIWSSFIIEYMSSYFRVKL